MSTARLLSASRLLAAIAVASCQAPGAFRPVTAPVATGNGGPRIASTYGSWTIFDRGLDGKTWLHFASDDAPVILSSFTGVLVDRALVSDRSLWIAGPDPDTFEFVVEAWEPRRGLIYRHAVPSTPWMAGARGRMPQARAFIHSEDGSRALLVLRDFTESGRSIGVRIMEIDLQDHLMLRDAHVPGMAWGYRAPEAEELTLTCCDMRGDQCVLGWNEVGRTGGFADGVSAITVLGWGHPLANALHVVDVFRAACLQSSGLSMSVTEELYLTLAPGTLDGGGVLIEERDRLGALRARHTVVPAASSMSVKSERVNE